MKEFNLEKAKQGAKVCTRDGRSVRILCFDAKGEYPIVALVDYKGGEGVEIYTKGGKFGRNGLCPERDLMLVGEKHEGWVVVNTSSNRTYDYVYDTKEQALEAEKEIMGDYTSVAKIEWED